MSLDLPNGLFLLLDSRRLWLGVPSCSARSLVYILEIALQSITIYGWTSRARVPCCAQYLLSDALHSTMLGRLTEFQQKPAGWSCDEWVRS